MNHITLNITGYLVRNQKGLFFRSKGLRGYGKSWVDDVKKAKLYFSIGPARAVITFFSKNYQEYGVPDLVTFTIGLGSIMLEERVRALKAVEKIAKREKEAEVRQKKRDLEIAQNNLERARDALSRQTAP